MPRQNAMRAKSANIHIRIAPEKRELIDRAASIAGKTRSEFILDAVTRAAEHTLLDQRVFPVDDAQWQAFTDALDGPPAQNEALHKLLHTPAPWDA
ncbi:MAG: DUF1778 domain-containing protein [Caldilineaceae bacterium]|nr:DUF1778 domain-containing protein [Caldilineaceae bacterium]MCB9160925.1 DUF1778 domain-containing protein [Caldilineaceae bacterium]